MGNHCGSPIVNKAIDEAILQTFGTDGTWNKFDPDDVLDDCVLDFLFFVLENLNIDCGEKDDDDLFWE